MACVCFVSATASSILRPSTRTLGTPVRRRIASTTAPRRAARMSLSQLPSVATPLLLSEFTDVNLKSLGVTAFVFFLTFWGGISFVKGSIKARETQASFTLREPASAIAKRTSAYLMERAFVPDVNKDGRKGVVTFTGQVRASSSVASLLVAVAGSGIWSLTYILNFVLPDNLQSPYWGLLSLLSLALVPWYWNNATREEEVKVMVQEEDDGLSTLFVKAHRDEIIEMEKAFNWKRNEVEEAESVAATPSVSSIPAKK